MRLRRLSPLLLLALVACVPQDLVTPPAAAPPSARLPATAQASGAARLELRLAPATARRLFAIRRSSRIRVTVDGPDMLPLERVASLGDNSVLRLDALPVGAQRLVTVQYLDQADAPIAGAVRRAVGRLDDGDNRLAIDDATTAAGAVMAHVLAHDRATTDGVLPGIAIPDLLAAMGGYRQTLGAASPALLDDQAIALAITATPGTLPPASASFLRQAGQLELLPSRWPVGARATVTLDDPLSTPIVIEGSRGKRFGPIAPGRWTLRVELADAAVPAFVQEVTVAEGPAVTQVALPVVAQSAERTGLLGTLAARPCGVARVGGVTYAVGAYTESEADEGSFYGTFTQQTRVTGVLPSGETIAGPRLALPEGEDVIATAVGDQLYVFGYLGQDGGGFAVRVDPTDPDATPTNVTPAPQQLFRMTPLHHDGLVQFIGDGEVLAYDPADDSWKAGTIPPLPVFVSRAHVEKIADTWYVVGGIGIPPEYKGSPPLRPVGTLLAWTPGRDEGWRELAAMPTPRWDFAATVRDGQIWTMGGIDAAYASSTAVEVFDLADGGWVRRAPLQRPRSNAFAMVEEGRIVLHGGGQGTLETLGDLLLRNSEELFL